MEYNDAATGEANEELATILQNSIANALDVHSRDVTANIDPRKLREHQQQ